LLVASVMTPSVGYKKKFHLKTTLGVIKIKYTFYDFNLITNK